MKVEEIVKALKQFPEKSILQVSEILGIGSVEVAEAQIKYNRPFIPSSSPLWGLMGKPVSIKSFKYYGNYYKPKTANN